MMHWEDRAIVDRFWSKVHKTRGCYLWQAGKNSRGYGAFKINGRQCGAHRVALEQHLQRTLHRDEFARHICDNPGCVKPAHLRVGTHADNMHDMVVRGRAYRPKGELHPNHKLSNEDIRELLGLLDKGYTQAWVANRYGVNRKTVTKYRAGILRSDASA